MSRFVIKLFFISGATVVTMGPVVSQCLQSCWISPPQHYDPWLSQMALLAGNYGKAKSAGPRIMLSDCWLQIMNSFLDVLSWCGLTCGALDKSSEIQSVVTKLQCETCWLVGDPVYIAIVTFSFVPRLPEQLYTIQRYDHDFSSIILLNREVTALTLCTTCLCCVAEIPAIFSMLTS